ncbi:MAG: hypothetical protein IJM64_09795 [Ottowia sp.]|nr:hypothetical protein [Ottowia sp.]
MKRHLSALAACAAFAALPCMAQMPTPNIPAEIYVPQGGTLVKVKRELDGDFEVKYHLPSGDIRALAQRARARAEKQGYRVFGSQDKGHEIEVHLVRGNTELEISVEQEWNGIDYEVEIDQHHHPRRAMQPMR